MMIAEISIAFPHLGIALHNVGTGIRIFGFQIAYYGIIIAIGMLVGYFLVDWQAKRTGQDPELYLDFALYAIVFSIIGARCYYVIFSWSYFAKNPFLIFHLRGGGLAIYGAILAGLITAVVYSKIKKISFWKLADTVCIGLVVGQAIGRWGNFFNREAFGGYTDGLFAMQLKQSEVAQSSITTEMLAHLVERNGISYIQVHPTFLYESLWNIGLFIFLLWNTKRKKFDGQLFAIYLIGYGIGRIWIEQLRTDQLLLWGTNLPVSQLLSVLLVLSAGFFLIKKSIAVNAAD